MQYHIRDEVLGPEVFIEYAEDDGIFTSHALRHHVC